MKSKKEFSTNFPPVWLETKSLIKLIYLKYFHLVSGSTSCMDQKTLVLSFGNLILKEISFLWDVLLSVHVQKCLSMKDIISKIIFGVENFKMRWAVNKLGCFANNWEVLFKTHCLSQGQ